MWGDTVNQSVSPCRPPKQTNKQTNPTIGENAFNIEPDISGKQLKDINAEEGVKENGNAKVNTNGTTATDANKNPSTEKQSS